MLITSLIDKKEYPCEIFGDLYHQRWGIEEDYKIMKSRLTIENFSGLSVEAIKQDIHAKILTKNIAAVAILDSEVLKEDRCKNRKHNYKTNFAYVIGQLKDNVVRLLMRDSREKLISRLIIKIAKVLGAYRPNRKFDRPHKRMIDEKYPIKYKRVC